MKDSMCSEIDAIYNFLKVKTLIKWKIYIIRCISNIYQFTFLVCSGDFLVEDFGDLVALLAGTGFAAFSASTSFAVTTCPFVWLFEG